MNTHSVNKRPLEITEGDESVTLINRYTTESITLLPQANGMGLRLVDSTGEYNFTWHAYSKILRAMIVHLHKFDENRPLPKGKEHCPVFKRQEWQYSNLIKAISPTFSKCWRKLISIERWQKQIIFDKKLATVRGPADWNHVLKLYRPSHNVWNNEYLYNDAITYKPCMMLLENGMYHNNSGWVLSRFIDNVQYKDWKQCFALNGETYKALNKTLFGVKWAIPLHELLHLNAIKLHKPLLTKLELKAFLTMLHRNNWREDTKNILQAATPKDWKLAIKELRKEGHPISLRSKDGMYKLQTFLQDYNGDTYYGDLVGLTKRAITYHENLRVGRIKAQVKYDFTTPTAKPTFSVEKIKGAKHLSTVAEVVEEGKIMGHCVAGYANSAVKGHCYLFHVDYENEKATVEVNSCIGAIPYRVSQSQGPHNKDNKASLYAKRKFTELFKELSRKKI